MITQERIRASSEVQHDYRRTAAVIAGVELVREAVPEDAEGLRRMFARCSRETIYLRFHTSWPTVPEWAIKLLLDGAGPGRDGRSIVAVAGTEIIGHAMYVRDQVDGREAEIAAIVEDLYQSGGVGRRLLSEIAAEARRAGVETLTCTTLGDNYRLLSVVSRIFPGSRTSYAGGECSIRMPLAG